MKSENNKTSDPQRLVLNLTDKLNSNRSRKYVALSNLGICYTWKKHEKLYKSNEFKLPSLKWNKIMNYLIDHILCQIFNIILSISSKDIKS